LTQTTQVHIDRSTDKHGQTKTVKETAEKAIYTELIICRLTMDPCSGPWVDSLTHYSQATQKTTLKTEHRIIETR